jgi:cystathionine beta-lyase/cystathionine gamma-synthase
MTEKPEWREETIALHAGYQAQARDQPAHRSLVPPMVQSAIFALDEVDQFTRIHRGLETGYTYGRTTSPTADALQQRLAALEGGERGLVTASGMLAVFALAYHLAKTGDELVTSHMTYGEAYRLFFQLAPQRMKIRPRLVTDPADLDDWERQITDRTRFIWAETPSNPTLFVTDIGGLAEIAHAHGIPLIVDNTLATPYLLQPLKHGADIVVHSLTKFIGGQGAVLGGSVVGRADLIDDLRRSTLAYVGAILSPFDAWLTLLSLETLPLRMARHSENAQRVATHLAGHPKVLQVNYPGLPQHPQHALAARQMPRGCGGLLSFQVQGGQVGAKQVMESFQLITIVPSFGTTRTIATHPPTHTHDGMTPEERETAGIYDGLIRLSVGIEAVEDLLADLDQALEWL